MTATSPPTNTAQNSNISFPASEVSGLGRVRAIARGALKKQWPTRKLEVCPPAYGAVVPIELLGAQELFRSNDQVALVLFAPDDYQLNLEALATQVPKLHTNELVGMRKKELYLSLPTPSPNAKLPRALWVRASDILAKHLARPVEGRSLRVPVLLVAGTRVAACHWFFDAEDLEQMRSVTQDCQAYVYQGSESARQNSLEIAQNYGERPWLFLRYDILSFGRKHATNWAPVCTFKDGKALEYLLD